jgi:putative oxidoreductase
MTSTLHRRPGVRRARPLVDRTAAGAATLSRQGARVESLITDAIERASAIARRLGPTMLRFSLALVFCWFGILKLTGDSPVYALIGATLPWFDPHYTVPLIGGVEVLLGIGLMIPKARRLVLIGLAAHLCGTFLTFAVAPGWVFRNSDPLLLTADGEFVLKNLVLISAAMVLLAQQPRRTASEPAPVPAARKG